MAGHHQSHIRAVDAGERAPRIPANAPAEVSFGDIRSRIECRVVNMSASGACLRILDPQRFEEFLLSRRDRRLALYLDKSTITVECLVAWCRDGHAGVSFQSGFIQVEAQRSRPDVAAPPTRTTPGSGRTFGRR